MIGAFYRRAENMRGTVAVGRGGEAAATEGGQDKRPHIAAWTVGCSDWLFSGFPHLAGHKCDVRTFRLSSVFNETCTLQRMKP
jgi:hypothetical protein